MEPETVLKYRRTLSELDLFLSAHRLQLADLSDVMTADWAVEMMRQGLAKSTIIRHLNILSSLVKPGGDTHLGAHEALMNR
ncbi:MAG: site-specific integrase, partial [Duncaniella sp.]|nr:site-specific integrase [Duncaniella sp.]